MSDELKVQLRKFYNAVARQHDTSLQTSSKGYSKAEKDEVDSCNWIIDKFKEFILDAERQEKAINNLKAKMYDLQANNKKMAVQIIYNREKEMKKLGELQEMNMKLRDMIHGKNLEIKSLETKLFSLDDGYHP